MRICSIAERVENVFLLSHPQKVRMLLYAAFKIELVEFLSADSVLPETETEESLLFIQIASAFCIFECEDCQSVLDLTRADLVLYQLENASL